jgi:Gram-negative bacterial TonB protein C-terminal
LEHLHGARIPSAQFRGCGVFQQPLGEENKAKKMRRGKISPEGNKMERTELQNRTSQPCTRTYVGRLTKKAGTVVVLKIGTFEAAKTNLSRLLLRLAIPVFLTCSLSLAQTKNEVQPVPLQNLVNQSLPSNSACPTPPGQGQVTVIVIVDAKGNVSQAKALSGPEELVPATLACAKTWKYEPPASAPVTKIVSVSYNSRDCPAAISERGEMQWSWVLRDKSGKVAANLDGEEPPAPPYPVEERKEGVAGRMVLSVSLNAEGYVKEIHAIRSLSPGLDKVVIDRLRPLKFTLRPDINPQNPIDLYFLVVFRAVCTSRTVSTIESDR